MTDSQPLTYFDALAATGMTGHVGGPAVTKQLLARCGLRFGQQVLDLGCGTGYTACLLARAYQVTVVAVDLTPKMLEWTQQRIAKEGVGERVTTMVANAEALPFPDQTFDAIIAESVLVFTDAQKVAAEAYRVLKPGGVFGANELSYRKTPPPHLQNLFTGSALGAGGVQVTPHDEEEWRAVFREAGFAQVSSTVSPINFLEVSLLTPLKTDGIRKYCSSIIRTLSHPALRTASLPKGLSKGGFHWFSYLAYLGYGLYVARKG